jgi:hypothetical protein
LELIKAKWFVKLLDQKLMKLLIVEKGLDLNQNLRTREAEQNKLSCWIKLIVEKALDLDILLKLLRFEKNLDWVRSD